MRRTLPPLVGRSRVTAVSFVVSGVPAPQGSKTRTKWGVREDNPATKPWRTAVAWEATAAMLKAGLSPLAGPLQLEVVFYFPRPKSHYGTGRNAAVLKPSAPLYHFIAPDEDKLRRAIGDAMKGIVYVDDSQICDAHGTKFYGTPRCEITVRELYETV